MWVNILIYRDDGIILIMEFAAFSDFLSDLLEIVVFRTLHI